MAPSRRPIEKADDLPRLRVDAERAISRYDDTVAKAETLFFERFGDNLAPDLLRLIAVRFLEMADEKEPPDLKPQGIARAYGWSRRTFTVRDAATLPTVHLVSHLTGTGWGPADISDELAARRITTLGGRVGWQPRIVAAIAEREKGRAPIWTGSPILEA